MHMIRTMRGMLGRLHRDTSGLALLEFAFSLPIVLGVGLYGVESSSLALANLRVSQAALNLADNASRVGTRTGLSTIQLSEADINDVMQQVRLQTQAWELTTRGRITLSSLENSAGIQRIHWQRCIGLKSGADYETHYGTTTITDGTDDQLTNQGTLTPLGMGPSGSAVNAPTDAGVMFVEINYDYKPVVGTMWLPAGSKRLHYIASFIVRDKRDFGKIINPAPAATRMTCDAHSA